MTCNLHVNRPISLLVIFIWIFSSCNYDTKEVVDKTSKILPNGKHLVVEKITKETTSHGVFTNHNYGTSHSFTYNFLITKEDIKWDGGSGEPKNILFYKNTVYVHYLKEKDVKTAYLDSLDNTTKYNYHSEIHEFFQKHIDERYFFKLFGNDYWVDTTAEDYSNIKKFSNEYDIPNDNELTLIQE